MIRMAHLGCNFSHCPAVERQSQFASWKTPTFYRKEQFFTSVNSTVPAVTLPVAGYAHIHVWLYRAQDRSGGSQVDPKTSPVPVGRARGVAGSGGPHNWLASPSGGGIPIGSGGPSEPWRWIDSCYQFNTGSGASAHRYFVELEEDKKQRK